MSKEAEARYKKKAMRTLSVSLHREKEKDIIEWWDTQQNRRQTVIDLIRKEIRKNG